MRGRGKAKAITEAKSLELAVSDYEGSQSVPVFVCSKDSLFRLIVCNARALRSR